MRTARVAMTAEDIVAGDAIVLALSRTVPRGTIIIDCGDRVVFRIPGGSQATVALPPQARDLAAFYAGRDTAAPVEWEMLVPDLTDVGAAA